MVRVQVDSQNGFLEVRFEGRLGIDGVLQTQHPGGVGYVEDAREDIEAVLDQTSSTIGTILDHFVDSPISHEYLVGLQGAIVQYELLFRSACKRRS